MDSLEKLKAFLELLRIHNIVVTLFTTYIGYITLTAASSRPIILDYSFAVASLVVGLIAGAGYVINDYFDVDIDRINKPYRPIPSGKISAKTAYRSSIILFITGIVVAYVFAGCISGTYALLTAVLLYLYSWRLKRLGLPGNIVIAFNSASSIFYGGLVYAEINNYMNNLWRVTIPFLYAFLLVLGREIVKGVEDYEGDRIGGAKTLAVILGPIKATMIAITVLSLVIIISPLPYVLGIYGYAYMPLAIIVDLLIVASAVTMLKEISRVTERASVARSLLKWSFMVGALAFIGGAITL